MRRASHRDVTHTDALRDTITSRHNRRIISIITIRVYRDIAHNNKRTLPYIYCDTGEMPNTNMKQTGLAKENV